ncbi:MAG: SBBP repeat-containing protein [Candidatus Heimdallarchaeota archaeon]
MNRKVVYVLIVIFVFNLLAVGYKVPTNNIPSIEITDKQNNKSQNFENFLSNFRSIFTENTGQISNKEILFYGSFPNGQITFGISEVILWFNEMNDSISFNFKNSNYVSPVGLYELEMNNNFHFGSRGNFINVKSYSTIIFNNLWEGIDLYYKITFEGLKYEFHVAPEANVEDICINFNNSEQLVIEEDCVTIIKGSSNFYDKGLKVLQEGREIKAIFISRGVNAFGFKIFEYDSNKPLIIDPLVYSTFIGGDSNDVALSTVIDEQGSIYLTGYTSSLNFPLTQDAFNSTHSGSSDCFVLKLSPDGSNILYSTFIGGYSMDHAVSIVVDEDGCVYVTGFTLSSDFPTTENAFNRTHCWDDGYFPQKFDCFVFKLSADGSELLYSTFVGGTDSNLGGSIAVNDEGNAFVTGVTSSSDFPSTTNAFDDSFNGEIDCFVFKLSVDGSALIYSTFIGGNFSDRSMEIIIDQNNNAFVIGFTESNDFPVTDGVFSTSHNGESDGFLCKLSADGSLMHFSTLIGGKDSDICGSIVLDKRGNIYMTGYTKSDDFPTTSNALNSTFIGDTDIFVTKFSEEGTNLLYSTLIGGKEGDIGLSIALDIKNNLYVVGKTESADFPVTDDAYNKTHSGDDDLVIFKISMNDYALEFSTFIGGSEEDISYANAIDNQGNLIVIGATKSSNFPTTENAYNRIFGGLRDCFILKLAIVATKGIGTPFTKVYISLLSSFVITLVITRIIHKRKKIS